MKNGSKLNLLVAEDNPNDQEILRQGFKRDDAEVNVTFVDDGTEVINYLEGIGDYADRLAYPIPDLLVLDLKMPLLTGLDVLRWLDRHPKCCSIPTVMLSGSGLEKDIKRAYALGVNTYFEKPMDFNSLASLLKAIIHYWALSKRPPAPSTC